MGWKKKRRIYKSPEDDQFEQNQLHKKYEVSISTYGNGWGCKWGSGSEFEWFSRVIQSIVGSTKVDLMLSEICFFLWWNFFLSCGKHDPVLGFLSDSTEVELIPCQS